MSVYGFVVMAMGVHEEMRFAAMKSNDDGLLCSLVRRIEVSEGSAPCVRLLYVCLSVPVADHV